MPNIAKNHKEVGYCALALAIIQGYTVESALEYIETGETKTHRFNSTNDIIDMIRLREKGLRFKDIGKIYNMTGNLVFKKIKRLRRRKETEDMVAMREAGFYYREIAEFYGDISKQAVWHRVNGYIGGIDDE